jgi:hypothetical protein
MPVDCEDITYSTSGGIARITSDDDLHTDLRQNPTTEILVIGGAERPGRLMDALHDGFFAARRI